MFQIERISQNIFNQENCPGYWKYIELSDGQNRCVMTEKYVNHFAEEIKNLEVFEDDVWVITFPKCGTTWVQEIVWLLNSNLDYKTALNTFLDERFRFLEIGSLTNDPIDSLKACKDLQRPRHIKSHLPKFLLPTQLWTVKPKIIYVARNPKDTAVSYYHQFRHIIGYMGTKEEFFDAFVANKLTYSPMNEHVLEFWKLRNEPNILFLFYEDMTRNLKPEIIKIMNFLGKNYSDEQIDKLSRHSSFESMKNNPSCNGENMVKFIKTTKNFGSKNEKFNFLREGKTGSFNKEMYQEQQEKFDNFMKFSELQKLGFSYKVD